MSREKKIVWGTGLFAVLLWIIDIVWRYKTSDWGVWLWRKEMINLTGIIAFVMMGVIMLLALRPKFLEPLFQGLDKIYYVHKWLGIWSIIAVVLHYGMKLSKSILQPYFEKGPKLGGDKLALLEDYRPYAKDAGEILFYLFVITLIITLLKRLPYRFWRWTHKIMGLLFLVVVFHSVVLAPARYWSEPVGIVFALISLVGIYASIISLFGLIGKKRQYAGIITGLEYQGDVTLATCQAEKGWTHQAGQYAFIRHSDSHESHPYTIASDDAGDQTVRFAIKALGHYTSQIQATWKVGDKVRLEGPYGQFFFLHSPLPKQVWIAGGVGITPFIAWMESLQGKQCEKEIHLYYCVNAEKEYLVPEYLQELATSVGITLHPHCSDEKGFLESDALPIDAETSVWFCGPSGFAKSIQKSIKAKGLSVTKHFHREYFDMR